MPFADASTRPLRPSPLRNRRTFLQGIFVFILRSLHLAANFVFRKMRCFSALALSGHASRWLSRLLLVESRCGAVAVGPTYLFPPLSSGGALVVRPWLRFHIPLIEPDMQISRIRLSDKTSRHCFCVRRHLQLSNTSRSC